MVLGRVLPSAGVSRALTVLIEGLVLLAEGLGVVLLELDTRLHSLHVELRLHICLHVEVRVVVSDGGKDVRRTSGRLTYWSRSPLRMRFCST